MSSSEAAAERRSNPFTRIAPRALIFDLDGTLVDSLPDIVRSVNALCVKHGRAELDVPTVQAAVGAGARILLRRLFESEGLPENTTWEGLYDQFLDCYREHGVATSTLYPGVPEFLEATHGSVALALLTNKPLSVAELVVNATGLDRYLDPVIGPENAAAKKPDPAGLLKLLEDLEVSPDRAIYFGDSVTDFETGINASVFTIGARFGYYLPTSPATPDLWVDGWDEVLALWKEFRSD